MQTIVLYFALAGVALTVPASLVLWLHEKGIRPLDEIMTRYRRLPVFARVLAVVAVAHLFVYGSTKTNRTDDVDGGLTNGTDAVDGPTNAPLPRLAAPWTMSFGGFTSEQLSAGFVRVSVRTNETWDFQPPADAHVVESWQTRGACDDWSVLGDVVALTNGFYCLPRPTVVFSSGGLRDALHDSAMRYSPLDMPLGVVPAANWGLIAKSNAQSQVWYRMTTSNSLVVTWRDVLVGRDTNTPASVQAEFFENGNFTYRYDLTRAGTDVSNALVGASHAGFGETTVLSSLVSDPSSLTSIFFHALDPLDALTPDRDGDGLRTYDEIFVHGTDPGLFDTDGDGVCDGREFASELDPFSRDSDGDGLVDGSDPDPKALTSLADRDGDGLPDAYEEYWYGGTNVCDRADVRDATGFSRAAKLVLGVCPTNEPAGCETIVEDRLVSRRLWDGFAATWPSGLTNLVFERTVVLDRESAWQQYYLSSRPDGAGGWALEGLTLEWETSDGDGGVATASLVGDSWRLPLSSNRTHAVTIRLRATSPFVRCARPIYLLSYAPEIRLAGTHSYELSNGGQVTLCMNGAKSSVSVEIDWTHRPCRSPLGSDERSALDLLEMSGKYGGRCTYAGDASRGSLQVSGADVFLLPAADVRAESARPRLMARASSSGGRQVLVILSPSISYGTDVCVGSFGHFLHDGEYDVHFYYPIDSDCLWHAWKRDFSGKFVCTCVPMATCGLPDDNGYAVVTRHLDEREISATISVGGEVVWHDRALHYGHVDDAVGCGGTVVGLALESCDRESCEGCEDGNCANNEGYDMGSMKFRIPIGAPRKNQVSGFVYFAEKKPMMITPSVFQYKFRSDAAVSVVTNGDDRLVQCSDARGRDLLIESVRNGVRITVRRHDTSALEHVWDIVNADGATNVVRFTKTSRLGNVMEDCTFSYLAEDGGRDHWQKTDHLSGVTEELVSVNRIRQDGTLAETRTRRDGQGCEVERRESFSQLIGEGTSAVLRETSLRIEEGGDEKVRTASYWSDPVHRVRNGKLKLLTANDRPWEYHEWDEDGRERLRVEQRNGADVPASFPFAVSNGVANAEGLADAFLTTYDYAPLPGDDDCVGDIFRVRCETRYVVEGGEMRMIGRTWHRFSSAFANGCEAIRDECWRAGSSDAAFGAAGNAYSYRVAFDDSSDGVPLVLRGETAEELDEDGVQTANAFAVAAGTVTKTSRKSRNGAAFPTYEVTVLDDTYGTVLRTATCLTANDVVINEERSVYDDQNRLRSTTYLDGTSLTNAYSCCRKLWSRDRQGRTTLRSARTGTDHLYYAEEETWLQDVSSNGFKVTQHFLDGFGRETNTVVYAGTDPGEATVASASDGKDRTESRAAFSGSGWDCETSVDERGKNSERRRYLEPNGEVNEEWSWSEDAVGEMRRDTETWNGPRVTRREWDDKWTERRTWDEYDADGCRVAYEVTESSDYGVVTNAIRRHDFLGREVSEETPQGVTTCVYDGTTGRVIESTLAAEDVVRTTTNLYDAFGENVGTVVDDVVRRRETSYEERSNVWWKVTRESVVGSRTNATSVTREQLTGLTDVCRARTVAVSAAGVRTETTTSFDAETGLETRTAISSVGGTYVTVSRCGLVLATSSDDGTTSHEYDALGRVVCETRTAGTDETVLPVRETEYNAFGDAVAVLSYTNGTDCVLETATYDAFGRCVERTDGRGALTTMEYDAQGNLVATDGATVPTRSTYDTAGRRTSLSTTRDGILWDVTTWEYDPGTGKCLKKRLSDGAETVRTYTPDGLEALVTRPSLQWRENIYDERRRLVGVVSNDGSENAAYGYDEFAQLTSASNAESVVAYARHRGGAATNECVRIGTNAVVLVRTVDAFGRLAGGGREGASQQTIGYATANRPATVSDSTLTAAYAYTPDGYDAGVSSVFSDGAAIRREVYRDLYRPNLVLAVSNYVNNALASSYDYAHDALGQSVRCNDDSFTYDSRRQLTSSLQPSQTFQTSQTSQTFSYDHIGNFTETVDASGTNVWTANALNQYASVGETAFSYTRDGGLSSDGRFDYTYDSGVRLTSVSTGGVTLATFAYDALDRRVRKTTPEATHFYFYDGWNLVLERIERLDGTVDEIEYFWGKDLSGSFGTAGGVGGLLYLRENGMEYAPLYDANGNVMQYVDRTGAVVASYVYDAFGRTLVATGPLADRFRFRFSTKYHDPETGLVYYGYRFYAPVHARWLTPDPLEEQGGLNLYAFCANNPVNGYDALGLFVNPLTGPGAFAFWEFVADAFFEAYDRSPVSAEMLRMSVWRLFGAEPHVFSGHSKLATAIKNSPEYKKIIDDRVTPLPKGKKDPFADDGKVHFSSHDLVSSVGDASWRFSGNVCKSSANSAKLDLKVTFEDIYNFEWWGEYKEKIYGWFLTFGNNNAYIFQEVGVLRTYKWEVTFDDGRMWKW